MYGSHLYTYIVVSSVQKGSSKVKKIFSLKIDQISLHFLMKKWGKKMTQLRSSLSTYIRLFFMHPFIIKEDSYDS